MAQVGHVPAQCSNREAYIWPHGDSNAVEAATERLKFELIRLGVGLIPHCEHQVRWHGREASCGSGQEKFDEPVDGSCLCEFDFVGGDVELDAKKGLGHSEVTNVPLLADSLHEAINDFGVFMKHNQVIDIAAYMQGFAGIAEQAWFSIGWLK